MSEAGIDKFFALARERYGIMLRKDMGTKAPWSTDPIFKREYFCNVFREDDKTTKWFRENIRTPLNSTYGINPKIVLLAIVAFRWFNRIETWDVLISSGRPLEEIFAEWDSDWVRQELIDHGTAPWVTGAYIIKTPNGMNKVDGVLWCIDNFIKHSDVINIQKNTMENAWNYLRGFPYLGNFTAWQICSDARQTSLLNQASDKNTWAPAGPGTTRGIGRTFYGNVDHFTYGSEKDQKEMLRLMQQLVQFSKDKNYWPQEFPPLAVIDIAHWACEVDKRYRAEEGGRMKRKYDGVQGRLSRSISNFK